MWNHWEWEFHTPNVFDWWQFQRKSSIVPFDHTKIFELQSEVIELAYNSRIGSRVKSQNLHWIDHMVHFLHSLPHHFLLTFNKYVHYKNFCICKSIHIEIVLLIVAVYNLGTFIITTYFTIYHIKWNNTLSPIEKP